MVTGKPVSQSTLALLPRKAKSLFARHVTVTAPQPINPAACQGWDALVADHRNHSFFHGAAWAATLQATYGFEPVYFTATTAGGRASVLPLMEVDSWLTGRRGIALPYTDECEPLVADASAIRNLIEAAMAFGRMRGWKSVEWRGGRELFAEAPVSLAFYGHQIVLEPDVDRMFARLESPVRRAVRKAEKSGVTVAISQSLDSMKIFYSLQCKTRRKHGLPPQPFAFFRNIFENILSKNLGMIAVASANRVPLPLRSFCRWEPGPFTNLVLPTSLFSNCGGPIWSCGRPSNGLPAMVPPPCIWAGLPWAMKVSENSSWGGEPARRSSNT